MTPEQIEEIISLGLRIVPTIDKKSVLKDWPNTAPSDPDKIRELFAKHPNAQPAAIVPEDITIFDIDIRNGGSVEALENLFGCEIPETLTVWSGRGDGGCHLYFKKPAREISARQLPPGVDLRKPGVHYVLIPPALHNETGQPYTWNNVPYVAELPSQAVEALAPPKPRVTLPAPVSEHSGNLNGLVRSVSEAVEGERNAKLYWASCRAFDHGDDAVIQDLFEAALSVGLTDSEASATIDSARRTDRQQPEPFVPHRSPITTSGNTESGNSPDSDNSQDLGNPQNENSHLSRHRDESDSSVESANGPESNNDAELVAGQPRAFEMDVAREAYRLRTLNAAREIVAKEQQPDVEFPSVISLDDFLAVEDDPIKYVIDQMMPIGAHGIITAQYKAGKTTLIGNLIRSLVDGDPFLDEYTVNRESTVTLIDNELDPRTLRRWLRSQGIKNTHRVKLLSLRGKVSTFNLLDDDTRAQWATMLQDPGVVILDCLRPVLDALGLDENREAGRFLVAFDEWLDDINATEAMLVHHMGHSGERSRGDSRLQDWPEMTWKLVRQDHDDPASPRYFTAFGRDVNVPESAIVFDPDTRHLSITEGTRKTAKTNQKIPGVLEFLEQSPGTSKTGIKSAIPGDDKLTAAAVDEALEKGLIMRKKREGRGGGYVYYLNPGEPR